MYRLSLKGDKMAKKKKIDNNTLLNSFSKTQKRKTKKIDESKEKKAKERAEKKALEDKQKALEKKQREEQIAREAKEKQEKIEEQKRALEANDLKTFKLKITTLSPVHIGNGEEYEPTNYVIRDDILYSFNEHVVIEKLYERDGQLPSNEKLFDMTLLVAFFRSEADFIIDNNLYTYRVSVSKDITKLYSKDFGISNNNDSSINQMLILEHIKTVNPYSKKIEPYLSGSSIKGALQSVLELDEEQSRYLKVSDAIGIEVKSHIAWSVRKTSKGNISQKIEVILKGSTFELLLTKPNSLSFEYIKEKIETSYKNADVGLYLNYSKELRDNNGLLRVGRYCGKEFIVKDLKEEEKPKTKSLFKMSEKNRRVDEVPFGWIKWELEEDKKEKQSDNIVEEKKNDFLTVEDIVAYYNDDMVKLINDMKNGTIENFDEVKVELALEVKKVLQQTPKTWDRAKKKALDRKLYIEGILK